MCGCVCSAESMRRWSIQGSGLDLFKGNLIISYSTKLPDIVILLQSVVIPFRSSGPVTTTRLLVLLTCALFSVSNQNNACSPKGGKGEGSGTLWDRQWEPTALRRPPSSPFSPSPRWTTHPNLVLPSFHPFLPHRHRYSSLHRFTPIFDRKEPTMHRADRPLYPFPPLATVYPIEAPCG